MSSAFVFATINVVNNTPWDLATGYITLNGGAWISAPMRIPKGETGQLTANPNDMTTELHGHVDYEVQDNDRSRLTVRFTCALLGSPGWLQLMAPELYTSTSSYSDAQVPLVGTATFSKAE